MVSISFGTVLVAGRNLVPKPAAGMMAFLILGITKLIADVSF